MSAVAKQPLHRALKAFFYGNYFYGLCVLAFLWASRMVLGYPYSLPNFDVLLVVLSIIGYQLSYVRVREHALMNDRSRWYKVHAKAIKYALLVEVCVAVVTGYKLLVQQDWQVGDWPWWYWVLAFSVPFSGALYHGFGGLLPRLIVRQLGLLKPLSIAYVWAGVGVLYPYFMQMAMTGQDDSLPVALIWLFFDGFIYIVILSVLFDIKDMAKDASLGVRTLPISLGLHKTYTYVLWPLCILNAVITAMGTYSFFSTMSGWLFATLPYAGLIVVMYLLRKRRSLLFYLAIVDGLMLIKALSWLLSAYLR